ncbi:MAG: hypothetical protein R3F17_16565 [Planctomycetota bacterium]
MEPLRTQDFLSKASIPAFTGYAEGQIRRARGLNKKVHNPMPRERKSVQDFCHVIEGGRSQRWEHWLARSGHAANCLGLAPIAKAADLYGLYLDAEGTWARGISSGPEANEVQLSEVPPGLAPIAYLHFGRQGYSDFCKRHREYWVWVNERNEARYQNTVAHAQGYDAKNMMHTLRLLDTALGIIQDSTVVVRRPDQGVPAGGQSRPLLPGRGAGHGGGTLGPHRRGFAPLQPARSPRRPARRSHPGAHAADCMARN